jgi:protein TonB
MSLGNGSSASAQPPMPPGFHGLNMQLSQADRNAMEAPQITVQGEIGSDWMSGFSKWVNAHIYYPASAAEQGQEGTSVIEFTVHRDGSVTGIHLLSSAGSPFLDQAWLGIFIQNHVPPFPPGTKSDTLKITASLEYVIEH